MKGVAADDPIIPVEYVFCVGCINSYTLIPDADNDRIITVYTGDPNGGAVRRIFNSITD